MLAKLALRNVKRQMGNYLIYFITVSLTVALMFALNNVIFSDNFLVRARQFMEFKAGMIALTVFISLIVSFILGYAASYMLKLRKREFGTYMTLGMTRGNILGVFLLETLLISLAALAAGLCLGFIFYQGLTLLISNLMEIEYAFSSYSLTGLLFTVLLVMGMFLLSSLTGAIYLKKVTIRELLHSDKKAEHPSKLPWLWAAAAVISLGAVAAGIIVFWQALKDSMAGVGNPSMLVVSVLIFAVGIVMLHFALSKSVVSLAMKSKRLRCKGANTFTLRQLSARLSSGAVLSAALAFLLSFAVVGANVSFLFKTSVKAELDYGYPYDVTGSLSGEENEIGFDEALERISRYADIESSFNFKAYTDGRDYLHSFTRFSDMSDTYVKESEFNALMEGCGRKGVKLKEGEFKIVESGRVLGGADFSSAVLDFEGKSYSYGGILSDVPDFFYAYFYAVIPDEAAENMATQISSIAVTLKEGAFDAAALRDSLSYQVREEGEHYYYSRCDYSIREYGRIQRNAETAAFTIGIMYTAIVFLFMSLAVLALKTLSGADDDKNRYLILSRLGADKKTCSGALFKQLAVFFFLPFVLPLLCSIPVGLICAGLVKFTGYFSYVGEIIASCVGVAGCLTAIYLLYFTATYLLAKRKTVAAPSTCPQAD